MGSTLYNKAFDVELKHAFYTYTEAPVNNEFKVNRDLRIAPTRECAELLNKGRMRYIASKKGGSVFYQAFKNTSNAQEALVALTGTPEFVFSLQMDVSAISLFLNVSNLNVGSKTYGPGKFFMLTQRVLVSTPAAPQTVTLNATLADSLRTSVFGYSFKPSPAWTGLADVVVKSESTTGPTVFTRTAVPYNAITGTFDFEIDLSMQPKGFYVMKAYQNGTLNEIHSTDFYVDGELAQRNTFGILRLTYEDVSKLYTTTVAAANLYRFAYTFAVRSVKWRYYVVAENLETSFFTNNDLKIIKPGGSLFYASYPGTFSQQNGQPDPVVKINGKNTVVLQSVSPIPFSEATQKEYELWKDPTASGIDERIIANLPNASIESTDSDQWGASQTPPTITSGISEIFVFI